MGTRIGMWHTRLLVASGFVLLIWVELQAEDSVVVLDQQGRRFTRVGAVLSYDAELLRMKLTSGAISRVPADRVLEVSTMKVEAHKEADRLFGEGDFRRARSRYQSAYRSEFRSWVRQQIVAQSILCSVAVGDVRQASTTFVALMRQHPKSRFKYVIPLAWRTVEAPRSFREVADRWLEDGQQVPVARLIAASWRLSGDARREALVVLENLASLPDYLGQLASAQIWRTQVTRAAGNDLARWAGDVDRLPRDLRAGPTYVLAQTYVRHRQPDQAALAYLRVAFTSPQPDLIPYALAGAGQVLHQSGRFAEAKRIYFELVNRYPDAPPAQEAEEGLRQIRNSSHAR